MKGISLSHKEHNKFGEFKKCSAGRDYWKECDNHITDSTNHGLSLQRVQKIALSHLMKKGAIKIIKNLNQGTGFIIWCSFPNLT